MDIVTLSYRPPVFLLPLQDNVRALIATACIVCSPPSSTNSYTLAKALPVSDWSFVQFVDARARYNFVITQTPPTQNMTHVRRNIPEYLWPIISAVLDSLQAEKRAAETSAPCATFFGATDHIVQCVLHSLSFLPVI